MNYFFNFITNGRKIIWLDVIVLLLVIIGALNWGLVGFFHFNLFSNLFQPGIERVLYAIVGLAGIYALWWKGSKILHKEKEL